MGNKKKGILLSILILLIIIVTGVISGKRVNLSGEVEININTALTVLISIVALVFSMITYFSIDSVDKKNKMDNNILQAENYRPAYSQIVRNLKADNEEEFKNHLMSAIKKPAIFSCMDYADWLQTIVDYVVFFAYYKWDNEKQKDDFINQIVKQKKKYEDIGSEIELLLNENISLIKHVINYQKSSKDHTTNSYSRLEDVQGTMLGNPIAKIVYYDYLGLDYMRYVRNRMNNFKFDKETFNIWKDNNEFEEKDKCIYLIEESIKDLNKAKELAKDDLLWNGYIIYNLARAEIIKFLFLKPDSREDEIIKIKDILDECISAREKVDYMFTEDCFLKEKFKHEKEIANNLKANFYQVFVNQEKK